MDRKFLEEHISAFVDGELEPKQMREFEREIEHHPDLKAELHQLQKLNQFSRATKVPMPPNGYFDQLAGRIDSRLRREVPETRSKFVDFILARRKTVAIVSSVAAVLLVVAIGVNMIGPNAKKYPDQIRSIEVTPAILNTPKSEADSVQLWPKREQKIVPPPVSEEEVTAKKDASGRADTAVQSSPSINRENVERKMIDAGGTSMRPASTRAVPTAISIEKESSAQESKPGEPMRSLLKAQTGKDAETPVIVSIFDEPQTTIQVRSIDENKDEKSIRNFAAPQTSTATEMANDAVADSPSALESELGRGHYSERQIFGRISTRDSLQAWADSISVIDPALWHAEQSYRESLTQEPTDENFAKWKSYIEHYMGQARGDDLNKWRSRLEAIHEKYEISKGKIYEPGRPSNE